MNIPVLIVAFNRPDLAARVATRIAGLSPPRIYVAVDGPRESRAGDKSAVAATIEQLRSSLSTCCDVRWLVQGKNLGCRVGVETAVSWIAAHEEFFAVFEDDCLPVEDIAKWLDFGRTVGDSLDQRAVISCFNHFSVPGASHWLLSSYFSVWGWATWSATWRNNRLDARTLIERIDAGGFDQAMGDLERANWRLQLQRIQSGSVDTWDAQWLLSLVLAGIPVLLPGSSLVQNIGFARADATHTRGEHRFPDAELVGNREWHFAGLPACYQRDRALAKKDYIGKGRVGLFMAPYRARLKQMLSDHPRVFNAVMMLRKSLGR